MQVFIVYIEKIFRFFVRNNGGFKSIHISRHFILESVEML